MKNLSPTRLFSILSFALFLITSCQVKKNNPSPAELLRVPIVSKVDEKERDYFLYLPKGYHSETEKDFPVLMFLHGNGERGNGKDELDYVMIHGPLYEAWVQKRDLPFIMIVPQLPMFGMDEKATYIKDRKPSDIPQRLKDSIPPRDAKWGSEDLLTGAIQSDTFPNGMITLPVGWDKCEEDLLAMFKEVNEKYRTDKKRIYLTGLSYGGFGTWWMASKHPEMFAAISPVVGWGHPDLMPSIAKAKIPIWVFAGGRDGAVPERYFYKGLNRLEELGHKDFRLTVEADMSHDVWKRVYAGEDIYNWLLTHELK